MTDEAENEPVLDPRALSTQVRFSDDETPTVWFVVSEHRIGPDGKPGQTGRQMFEVAGGLTPLDAAMRLCDQLIDGGTCAHCGRPTGFSHDFERMPMDKLFCWYAWDPELATFRRGCEGQT